MGLRLLMVTAPYAELWCSQASLGFELHPVAVHVLLVPSLRLAAGGGYFLASSL